MQHKQVAVPWNKKKKKVPLSISYGRGCTEINYILLTVSHPLLAISPNISVCAKLFLSTTWIFLALQSKTPKQQQRRSTIRIILHSQKSSINRFHACLNADILCLYHSILTSYIQFIYLWRKVNYLPPFSYFWNKQRTTPGASASLIL